MSSTIADVVLGCGEIDPTLKFFTETLGFGVISVFPADDPVRVVIAGHGIRLCLLRGGLQAELTLRLPSTAGDTNPLIAPNGTRVEFLPAAAPLDIPLLADALVITRATDANAWVVGRAGMQYRDLVPTRAGGFAIASHIRIVEGGAVPDYVHYHRVHFQMIYCRRGWVRVVYEDQGEPFVMKAGDCVLQPPQIRHRVLECSPGLEVIEVGVPARHETLTDPALALPTPSVHANRRFANQQFVRHSAPEATWSPWRVAGFEARDTGIGTATQGIADVKIARWQDPSVNPESSTAALDLGFHFGFVLGGSGTLVVGDTEHALRPSDAFVVPPRTMHTIRACSAQFELLEVTARA